MAVLPLRFYGDPDNNKTNNNHLAATTTTQLTSTARQIINSSNDCNNNNETTDILHFPVPVLLLPHRLLSIPQVVRNARRRHPSSFIHQLYPSDCKTFSTIRNDWRSLVNVHKPTTRTAVTSSPDGRRCPTTSFTETSQGKKKSINRFFCFFFSLPHHQHSYFDMNVSVIFLVFFIFFSSLALSHVISLAIGRTWRLVASLIITHIPPENSFKNRSRRHCTLLFSPLVCVLFGFV